MIIDISDSTFKEIFTDERLFLPIRWDGLDFSDTLEKLLDIYIEHVKKFVPQNEMADQSSDLSSIIVQIEYIKELLLESVRYYLNGFPARAFHFFKHAMSILMQTPLEIYQKSVLEQFEDSLYNINDELNLFRAVKVQDNKPYARTRVFHTPYNMRSKVSSSRYSIAGYPSLYLGTSLELCCREIGAKHDDNYIIASLFKLDREFKSTNINIRVIELGVKPQDFFRNQLDERNFTGSSRRHISNDLLQNNRTKSAYLLWYPLIAASSFIRVSKKDPFAAEYIIPQMLMQWVRRKMTFVKYPHGRHDQLIGIRYFSCASASASEMGFNYVFPTSGKRVSVHMPYCAVLAKAFCLTPPILVNEFDSIVACENKLLSSRDLDHIC